MNYPFIRKISEKVPQHAAIPASLYQPEPQEAKIQPANSKRIRKKSKIRGRWEKKSDRIEKEKEIKQKQRGKRQSEHKSAGKRV